MIRQAAMTDAPDLASICRQVQRLHAHSQPGLFKSDPAEAEYINWFKTILANPSHLVRVAVEAGAVRGYVLMEEVAKPESVIRPPLRYFVLHHIGVDEKHRGRGMGRALLQDCFQQAKQRQINRIELEVWSFNDAARGFFARHGFDVIRNGMSTEIKPGG